MTIRSHSQAQTNSETSQASVTDGLRRSHQQIEGVNEQEKLQEKLEQTSPESGVEWDFSRVPVRHNSLPKIQPKLNIGQPGDKYEREADRVAERVMQMPHPLPERKINPSPVVPDYFREKLQRQETEEEDDKEETLQAKQSDSKTPRVTPNLENHLNTSRGSGQSLPESTRVFMEDRFGTDFSGVRVHTDSSSVKMNRELRAQAFTCGNHIYFAAGKSPGKDELTAHELTHTLQQQKHDYRVNRKLAPSTVKQFTSETPEKTFNQEQTKVLVAEKQPALEAKKLDSSTVRATPNVLTVDTPSANLLTTASETAFIDSTDNTSAVEMTGVGESATNEETASLNAEDPGQIIEQLKNTPPTETATTYTQAQTSSIQALEKQRQQVQATIPEIPAPTGLPAKQTTQSGQVSHKIAEPAAGEINFETKTSGEAETKYETSVPEAPPPPPPGATQLAGAEVSEEGQQDAALSRSAQNALENIQINTNQISTSAGDAPNIDLSGEANPKQIETAQSHSSQEVSITKTKAAQATHQDFGENNIFPEPSNETIKTNKEISAISPPEAQAVEFPSIPTEAVGSLNQSLSPFLKEKVGVEQDKYKTGKNKFDIDSAQAKTDANQEIAELNEQTKQKQLTQRQQTKLEVAQYKQEWRTELDGVERQYQEKAGRATQEQSQKINQEKVKGEKEAAKHLEAAEHKAELEKQKAEKEVVKKKEQGKKESGGFWGWVKSKAKDLIDGIKKAVNFIYDNLRKTVKAIFEAAKKLALTAIDLARKTIIGFIKAFGEILKGLVKVVFAAFPEIAQKITAKIDSAVDKAEQAVNAAADALKKAVTAVIDFLANAIDYLLELIQDIYNGIITVIGLIVTGEFTQLFKGINNLIEAAKTAPFQFETAAYEELLGGNLDEPLSPEELIQAQSAEIKIPSQQDITQEAVPESEKPTPPWTPENVRVDEVENNMELSPELAIELLEQTSGENAKDKIPLAESKDSSRSMESIIGEVFGNQLQGGETQKQQYQDDGLTPRQRAQVKWELMKKRISDWWSDNWHIVIGVGILGLVAFIAANILTGGLITAALPVIMSILGPLFIGVTIAIIAGHIRDYLAKGWQGDIQGGGKSLAKGLAAGAVELISWLTFKIGSAAVKGAKVIAKGAKTFGKAGVKFAKGAAKAIAKGAKYAIKKGKVIFKGIAKTKIGKQFKKLRNLGKGLLQRMRFKAFRILVKNRRFTLEGLINPWVIIAEGNLKFVTEGTEGALQFTDEQLDMLKKNLSGDALQSLKNLKQDEIDSLIKLIQKDPKNADDILRQYFYKVQKGTAEIPENVTSKLQNSLDNFDVVKSQGYPYGFNNMDEFRAFHNNIKSALGRYNIPVDDIRVHGSAVHKTTPGDLDIAILVDKVQFEELGQRFIANSNQSKVAASIRKEIAKGKIPSYRFRPGEGESVVSSLYGKAGNIKKIQVSLILKGSSFDIGPYLQL
ncbi:MAG: DUF4157 domain-containing protein [Cyanobacteriota bacterium]|nr:DUF4157 domain-containing protein [Cyanobacteriota bacterium]